MKIKPIRSVEDYHEAVKQSNKLMLLSNCQDSMDAFEILQILLSDFEDKMYLMGEQMPVVQEIA